MTVLSINEPQNVAESGIARVSLELIAHILLQGQNRPCTTGQSTQQRLTPEIGARSNTHTHARLYPSLTFVSDIIIIVL